MANRLFDYNRNFAAIDFRKRPDLYQIGNGEQGVLLVQPYKDELLPHWKFKTVMEAKRSSDTIYSMFRKFVRSGDFPCADMARKYLQMGWTRARRYANHSSGRKYDRRTGQELPRSPDAVKAAAATIFYNRYLLARNHSGYLRLKNEHVNRYES